MFESYHVQSEQLGFLEANRKAPDLTILCGGELYAAIEFSDKTLYNFRSPHSNIVGRAGLSHSERDAMSWYVSAFDATSKVKRAEGIFRQGQVSGYSEMVVAIENFVVCVLKKEDGVASLSRNNGEIVGRMKLLGESSGLYAQVEILDRLEPAIKDYILILLTLLGKKHAWFVIQMPFGTCQGFPGGEIYQGQ